MKKSKLITLVLITSALASCNKEEEKPEKDNGKQVYMRSDESAGYSHSDCMMYGLLWYYAFRPYGYYNNVTHVYHRTGYYSSGINEHSNIGRNAAKSNAVRGGFGGSSMVVSS